MYVCSTVIACLKHWVCKTDVFYLCYMIAHQHTGTDCTPNCREGITSATLSYYLRVVDCHRKSLSYKKNTIVWLFLNNIISQIVKLYIHHVLQYRRVIGKLKASHSSESLGQSSNNHIIWIVTLFISWRFE